MPASQELPDVDRPTGAFELRPDLAILGVMRHRLDTVAVRLGLRATAPPAGLARSGTA
jgi:hypothetical protein